MRTLMQDVLFAARQLARHRGYAATAVLSMALGIGATVAVYSVLYGVLIDPYPYRNAERIAAITVVDRQNNADDAELTWAESRALRDVPAVESVQFRRQLTMISTEGDLPEPVRAIQMPGNGLEFLEAPALLGRIFTSAEAPDGVEPPNVAVVSYLFWKSHLGGRGDVIGRTLQLNHRPYTLVGVMDQRFTWGDAQVYLPLPADIDKASRYQTMIRLRPGVSYAVAQAQVDGFIRQVGREHPELQPKGGFKVQLQSLNDYLLREFKGTLLVLFVAVALLLLIGCGNLSILMLARGTARQQELAIRSALGASRGRIVRQLLTEAVMLSGMGGAAGIGLAYAAIRLIVQLIPEYAIPHEVVISLNVPVLLFSVLVSVVTGIVAGLSPALAVSRPDVSQMIQASSSRNTTMRGTRAQRILIGGQIALTVLLLAGAGAAMRNFLEAFGSSLGFDPHHVVRMSLSLPEQGFPSWQGRIHHFDALLERVASTPGVRSAALSQGGSPPSGNWVQNVQISGQPRDYSRQTGLYLVTADYFRVLRIGIAEGRTMTRQEVASGTHVAVVSRLFAQRFFPGRDAIGEQILPGGLAGPWPQTPADPAASQPFRVVGVVEDVRNNGMHRPIIPQAYLGLGATLFPGVQLLIRADGDPKLLLGAVGESIRSLDENQGVANVYSYDEYLSMFVWSHERFISVLFGLFSAVALALAAIGLISVMSYTVEQRTREIGLRIALGAGRGAVVSGILRPALRTTALGLAVGVLLSVGLSNFAFHWTQSSMRNPAVLLMTCGVLLAASAVSCVLPARRVLRVDPIEALRAN